VSQMSVTAAASIAPYIGGVIYEWSPFTPFYIIIGVSPLLSLVALTKPFREEGRSTRIESKQ